MSIDRRLHKKIKLFLTLLIIAETLGLDKKSIKLFIVYQMNVAKAIKYRYKADWLSMPETMIQYYNLADIRLKITTLTNDTIQLIAKELKIITK
ncbi:MAG: hypothetical protein ACL7BU_03975 [Candidatus Phlomobacter fragariae]